MAQSKSPSYLDNSAGFSLLEVMIAILILAFITFSTYQLVNTNTETKTKVVKEDREIIQTLAALGRIDSDFSQLYTPLFSNSKMPPSAAANDVYADVPVANGSFDGKSKDGNLIPQVRSDDKSSLIFLTQANRRKFADSKESRFTWIKYSIRSMQPDPENPDEKISGLYEVIRQTIPNDIFNSSLDWEAQRPQVLIDRVKSFEFFFWDERTKKFATSLSELNENKNLLRTIKVEMVWVDENENEQKIVKTFRVLAPYFNTKKDELQSAPLGSTLPGSEPVPNGGITPGGAVE